MHVSVVICTWNRADLLERTLEQLTCLRSPASVTWELILVNNACTDHTEAVAKRYVARLPLRYVYEANAGLAHARNAGLRAAKGQFVLWTDDDVLVEEGWLEACVSCIERHPDAAAIGGLIEPWFLETPDPLLLEVFPSVRAGFCGVDHGPEERPLTVDETIHGANFATRADVAAGLHFDTTLGHSPTSLIGGEETAFVGALRQRGGSVVWCPTMRVQHLVPSDRLELSYLRRFMIGRGARLARSARDAAPTQTGVPRWVYRKLVEHRVAATWHRWLGHPRESLSHLRDAWIVTGMLQEYRR